MRLLLLLILLAAVAIAADEVPASGRPEPRFAALDAVVLAHRDRCGALAATVAVARGGTILHSRGFGWSDRARRRPVAPDALMRLASCTKPITAALVRRLAAEGDLALDQPVFPLLAIPARPGPAADPRGEGATLTHLLTHRGGWDRTTAGDPTWQQSTIGKALGLGRPAGRVEVAAWARAQPLQFSPGERESYSNLGYLLLGLAVERATGRPFADVLQTRLLTPCGLDDILPARTAPAQRDRREVAYGLEADIDIEFRIAHGGLVASAPALCKFMAAFRPDGHPRETGKDVRRIHTGSLPGTTALMLWRRDGLDVAVLFNARASDATSADAAFRAAVDAALDAP